MLWTKLRLKSNVTLTSSLEICFASQGHSTDVYLMDHLLLYCMLIFVPPPLLHTFKPIVLDLETSDFGDCLWLACLFLSTNLVGSRCVCVTQVAVLQRFMPLQCCWEDVSYPEKWPVMKQHLLQIWRVLSLSILSLTFVTLPLLKNH